MHKTFNKFPANFNLKTSKTCDLFARRNSPKVMVVAPVRPQPWSTLPGRSLVAAEPAGFPPLHPVALSAPRSSGAGPPCRATRAGPPSSGPVTARKTLVVAPVRGWPAGPGPAARAAAVSHAKCKCKWVDNRDNCLLYFK